MDPAKEHLWPFKRWEGQSWTERIFPSEGCVSLLAGRPPLRSLMRTRVVISSDEDDGADASGDPIAAEKKKLAVEQARQARWRMELTPPPDLSAEREKELSRIIASVPGRMFGSTRR